MLEGCWDFAKLMLTKRGDFFPFGETADETGRRTTQAADVGQAHPRPQELYAFLEGALIQAAAEGEIAAVALAANVNIPAEYKAQFPDGIRVHVEAIGYARYVYLLIHVPDVRATVDWYEAIGFTVTDTYDDGGEGLSFAILSFGRSEVMFNSGGQPSTQQRREVDLYVYTDDVDGLHQRLKDRVEVVKGLHDTFFGAREFIIRDLNRFWMTFAQFASDR